MSSAYVLTVWRISHSTTKRQSRAEQKLTAGNQPARSLLASGPAKLCSTYNPSARTAQKTPFPLYPLLPAPPSARTPQKTPLFKSVHWRPGCCLATAVVSLIVSRLLPSNGSLRHNTTIFPCNIHLQSVAL
jgi:hypothetical protein